MGRSPAPFLAYINRCQFLLQQGLFVADACYYYGDHVPNFAQLKRSDPARVLPGYDYDVVTEEAFLTRMSVRGRAHRAAGRHELPRAGVARPARAISLPVLRKLKELVKAGATVIGPRPTQTYCLHRLPEERRGRCRLAESFGGQTAGQCHRECCKHVGKGRVISGQTAREVLAADGVKPDFDYSLRSEPSAR